MTPDSTDRSEWHTPVARIATRTSPGPGPATVTSSRRSSTDSGPGWVRTAARTRLLLQPQGHLGAGADGVPDLLLQPGRDLVHQDVQVVVVVDLEYLGHQARADPV